MKILSVNVGLPREVVTARDGPVLTSIFKSPVPGRVMARRLNLDGDRQSDLTVHGGPKKAIYLYPQEHYAFWRAELPHADLGWGSFGENLTSEGVLETSVSPGDTLEIGGALFEVTIPRMPCFKLGIRFNRADMVKRFWRSGRCGFYLSVVTEGHVGAGDAIHLTRRDAGAATMADVFAATTQR